MYGWKVFFENCIWDSVMSKSFIVGKSVRFIIEFRNKICIFSWWFLKMQCTTKFIISFSCCKFVRKTCKLLFIFSCRFCKVFRQGCVIRDSRRELQWRACATQSRFHRGLESSNRRTNPALSAAPRKEFWLTKPDQPNPTLSLFLCFFPVHRLVYYKHFSDHNHSFIHKSSWSIVKKSICYES